MNKRFMVAVLAIMVAIGGALFTRAEAQPDFQGHPAMMKDGASLGGHHRLDLLAEILELSDDQRTRIEELFTSQKDAMQPYVEQLKLGREAIREAALNPEFDEALIRELATRQAEAKIELIVAKARMHNQVFALLTPEQQEKAKKLHPLMEGHRKHRRGF